MEFPIFKTKIPRLTQKFDLADPVQRRKYFQAKAGKEIEKIRDYLNDGNTFIAYLLGKKNAGKGTYAKLFAEAVATDRIEHLSVGDIVRMVDKEIANPRLRKKLEDYLKANYRGFLSIDELFEAQRQRSNKRLLPTEFILALIRREIGKRGKKALFLDGFPRDLDQIKYRVVCPKCQTPGNLKLLVTKKVGFDPKTKEFYLVCDNPA